MPQYVEVNGETVEFPDDMSDEQIAQALSSQPSTPSPRKPPSAADMISSPLGIGGALGLGETALTMGSSALTTPIAGLAGIGASIMPGGRTGAEMVDDVTRAGTYQPRSESGQRMAGALGRAMEPIERFADTAGEVTGDPDDVLGATAVKTALLGAPALLGLRSGPRSAAAAAIRPKRPSGPPTVEQLLADSRAAYARAGKSGVELSPEGSQVLLSRIAKDMDGLDPTLHPRATAALKRVADDFDSGVVDLDRLETLRRIANDARSAADAADARFAGKIVKRIEGFVDELGKQDSPNGPARQAAEAWEEARDLYSRGKKGESLEELIDAAKVRASKNFSQSGIENALRTEFMKVFSNKRKFKKYTKAEQAAIRKVAEGGGFGNAMRELGKYAPSSAFALLQSGAIGAGIGAATGLGPVIGGALLPAAGAAGRFAATKITEANARRAAELARAGRANQ